MPKIENSVTTKTAINVVSDFILNIYKFGEVLDGVRDVHYENEDEKSKIINWFIVVDEAPIKFQEKLVYDPENNQLHFELLKGDIDQWDGVWQIFPTQEGTQIVRVTNYTFGFGIVDTITGGIIQEKLSAWHTKFLNSVKKRIDQNKEIQNDA